MWMCHKKVYAWTNERLIMNTTSIAIGLSKFLTHVYWDSLLQISSYMAPVIVVCIRYLLFFIIEARYLMKFSEEITKSSTCGTLAM